MPELSATLLDVAADAAMQAGALLREGEGHARHIETKSSATDMVSEMDRAAEATIRKVIVERRPGDAVLGEEGGEIGGVSGIRWVVDPLDGTTNFLYRLPVWCVSVAAEDDRGVVAGVVYDPVHAELWTATRGGGAFRNGEALARLGDDGGLATALVGTGFGYLPEARAGQGRVIAYVLPRVRDIRRAGSAALDLCWVAGGRLDAYFEEGTHHWDRAAGALIAREAGAWVGAYDGGEERDGSVVAARPGLAGPLRDLLAAATGDART